MNVLEEFLNLNIDLECIGLLRSRDFGNYFCTPENAIVFAHLGVDGIHFCIVSKENGNNLEESPVYVINPMDSDHYVELVGRNFLDFLSLIVSCKDASALECVSYMDKDRFEKYIQDASEERVRLVEYNQRVEKAIEVIKATFEISQINNLYDHIHQTRDNLKFTVNFSFPDEYYDVTGEPR